MESSQFLGLNARTPIRAAQWAAALFAGFVSLTALGESVGLVNTPLALELGVGARMPQVFFLHMASGGAALAFILCALGVRRHRALHRVAGRAAALCGFVAGVSAIPVGFGSTASDVARASFITQGALWLVLLAIGLHAIRSGERARHRIAMSLMSAAAFGAVLLRVLLSLHAALFPLADFSAAYGVMTWASWCLPLAGTSLYLRWRPSFRL
jgi:uncharacterized membrane protein YozB (DUF420 family)